jgi:hypothetical protein
MAADIFVLNPPVVEDFCRSARWAARSRGRVQRHPDWLLTAVGVLEAAGFKVDFLDGIATRLEREHVASVIKKSSPELGFPHHDPIHRLRPDLRFLG